MAVSDDLSFELVRVVGAPADQVWRAWSDADLVKRWWGPAGFSWYARRHPARNGFFQRTDDAITGGGYEIHNLWTYTVVEPIERIEFYSKFCDQDGNPVKPGDLGMPAEIPERVPHVVMFKGDGEATVLTVQEFGYAPNPILDMSKAGQEQCLDQLAVVAAEA